MRVLTEQWWKKCLHDKEKLEQIATKHGMNSVRDCHDKGLEALGLKILETK